MKLRYEFKLYPNASQEAKLRQAGGATRWLWNNFLNENIEKYKQEKKFVFYHKMATSLPKLKSLEETS